MQTRIRWFEIERRHAVLFFLMLRDVSLESTMGQLNKEYVGFVEWFSSQANWGLSGNRFHPLDRNQHRTCGWSARPFYVAVVREQATQDADCECRRQVNAYIVLESLLSTACARHLSFCVDINRVLIWGRRSHAHDRDDSVKKKSNMTREKAQLRANEFFLLLTTENLFLNALSLCMNSPQCLDNNIMQMPIASSLDVGYRRETERKNSSFPVIGQGFQFQPLEASFRIEQLFRRHTTLK